MPTAVPGTVTEDPQTQPGKAARQSLREIPGEVTRKPAKGVQPRDAVGLAATAPGAPPADAAPARTPQERPAQSAVADDIDRYAEVEREAVRATMPAFDSMVIYMGNKRNKSVSLPGHMHIEMLDNGAGELVEHMTPVPREGIQCYDFATHGTDNRLLRGIVMPPSARYPELTNRRAHKVHHPDHLLWFHNNREIENGPPAFSVRIVPEQRTAWETFLLKNNRYDAVSGADLSLVDRVLKDA